MGKRKWRADHNKTPPPPDIIPYASRMDSSSKEKSSHSIDGSGLKSLSSIMGSSMKLPNVQHSQVHHHHNLSHAILSRHPRHYYGRQYSRRNSANSADASSSHLKSFPFREEKHSLKLASQCNLDSGHHRESWDKAFRRPERIRCSSLSMDTPHPDVVKMVCDLCQKLLKKRPHFLGNTVSSSDVSVVAVLVCGHVYHADCLEQRTSHEDRRDPPCPLCVSLLLHADSSRGEVQLYQTSS